VADTEANRDPHLYDKLKAEAPGTLNWMLAGLRDYKTNGLNVAQAIRLQQRHTTPSKTLSANGLPTTV
jgi:phage/plasmid-associated DNA primase